MYIMMELAGARLVAVAVDVAVAVGVTVAVCVAVAMSRAVGFIRIGATIHTQNFFVIVSLTKGNNGTVGWILFQTAKLKTT